MTLKTVHPKLPMRNKETTKDFYINQLGFEDLGDSDFEAYLILGKDNIEIHFFEFKTLEANENYGQIYIRTNDIESIYQYFLDKKIAIHPNGFLEKKPWGQTEFSILDPDNNLLTFGNL